MVDVEPRFKGKPRKRRGLRARRPPVEDPELTANREVLAEQHRGWCIARGRTFALGFTGCDRFASHVHHRRRQGPGREKGGGHMLANLLPVCWSCHAFIHDIKNRDAVRAVGLLVLPDDPEFDELGAAA